MIRFFMGVDLGQAHDYSAVSILEQELKVYEPKPGWRPINPEVIDNTYLVRYLERFKLGTPYPLIVERIARLMEQPQMKIEGKLIVDATGVGAPVVDMMKLRKLRPVCIKITSGHEVTQTKDGYHVPKVELVSALAVLFHSKRIKVAAKLPEAKYLRKEVLAFKYKIDRQTGHTTYGADEEAEHDDIVLSVSLASWYAMRGHYNRATIPGQEPWKKDEKANAWNPLD